MVHNLLIITKFVSQILKHLNMKKLLTLALATSFLFASCKGDGESEGEGGNSPKGTKFEMTNKNAPLDKFEMKSAAAFKSGMNWNGKQYQPVMYLAISNQDKIEFSTTWNNVKMPEKEGEIMIVFAFAGKKFDHGAEPIPFETGDYGIGGEYFHQDMSSKADVYLAGKAHNLMMGTSYGADDFTGMAKITNLSKDMVEGTIELKCKDGSTVNVEFSEKIQHDFWESSFKGGKM